VPVLQFLHKFSMAKRKNLVEKPTPVIRQEVANTVPHTEGKFYKESFFKKYWPAVLLFFTMSWAMYHACIPYGYVLDDKIVITDNEYTKKGFAGIWDILTTESFQGYFGEKKEFVQGNRYRPLSIVTFAMEYGAQGQLNPKVSHIINILLYAYSGVLLMMVLTMMFRNFKPKHWVLGVPFIASVIFLVHPVHVEAVANIKGRDEIMSMLFSLAALYAAMRYTDTNDRKWLITSLVTYFLGLLSKENAITFLAVIPLTIYFFGHNKGATIKKLLLWLGVTTFIYLMVRFNTAGVPKFNQQITDLMNNPFLGMTPFEKLGSIMYTMGKYIALMVFPHPLSHDYYPYAIPKTSLFTLIPLMSLVGYVALSAIGIIGWKTKNIYSYSILFYLATLSIVSNIVINLGTFMNERFIFMASAGFCIAVAYFLSHHLPKLFNSGWMLGAMIALGATVGYGLKSYVRVPVWENALSLNRAAVAVSGGSARANSFMSTAIFEDYKESKGSKDEKKEMLRKVEYYAAKAVNIVPDYNNANLMLVGVVTERFKMDRDIYAYTRDMKPIILRRPDIPFIKEFCEYLKDFGYDEGLFPFYVDVGKELLNYSDKRRNWALMYLEYAYHINKKNKELNETLALAYELRGDTAKANAFRAAAQNLE